MKFKENKNTIHRELKKDSKICSACGNVLNVNAMFCPKCGTPFTQEMEKKGKSKGKYIGVGVIIILILCAISVGIFWAVNQRKENKKKEDVQMVDTTKKKSGKNKKMLNSKKNPVKKDEKSQDNPRAVQKPKEKSDTVTPKAAPIQEQVQNPVADHTIMSPEAVEAEVSYIRDEYNEIVANRKNGIYEEQEISPGIVKYNQNGIVKCIAATAGTEGSGYTRTYYFDEGKLIFAYLEDADANRLYFKNDTLFRWRYTRDATVPENAENHDNENSEEFHSWENFALEEAYKW